ncbi:MAG TPA: MXAN_5187 C-terminal domain-containing protein [Candidatus Polarisedimenticolia bacterium]|nr:MXAN_5187 C-terminal domain-containing protein [Candidatus Polarisedimenticolia bacterium]
MADINPIEESLGRIEVGIRQLKIQYDMFFSGVIPRQPFESRKDLEILLKTLGNTPMQRFADRYRYNALASKYQTMVELWNKMIRAKEEGRLRPGIPGFVEPVRRPEAEGGAPSPPPARAAAAAAGGPPQPVFYRSKVSNPASEDGSLRVFYDRFLEAHRITGGSRKVTYEQFVRQIQAKTESIRRKAGCEAVSYSIVIKESGVSLKAAPAGTLKEEP